MAAYVQEMMMYGSRTRPVADVVAEAMEAEDASVVNNYVMYLLAHACDTQDALLRRRCDEIRRAHGWRPFAGPPASENNLPRHAQDSDGGCPACLSTPKARELWRMAIAAGWVDEQLQPKLSRTDAALLAGRMAELLGIEGWKPFEQLWRRQNMRVDFCKGNGKQSASDFLGALNAKLR